MCMIHINDDISRWSIDEFHRIQKITDEDEKTKQIELMHEFLGKVWDYEQYVAEYDMYEKLGARNMEFKKSDLSCKELESIWNQTFTNKLTQKEKDDISFNQYMWHVFSYEKIDCLKGIDAKNAFNMANKDKVYLFYPQLKLAYVISNANDLNVNDLRTCSEVYVMDIENRLTFVYTHEGGEFVYFYEITNKVI